MNGLRCLPALGVVCFLSLPAALLVAADPPPEVSIRTGDGNVVIPSDQIRSYDWATHTLTLTPKAREELAKQLKGHLVSGSLFEVAVDGQAVYQGMFTTMESSRSFSTPVIVVDAQALDLRLGADQLRIQLGYPTEEFFEGKDPRADRRIQEALQAAGKLIEVNSEHTKWIAHSLSEMQSIKPGMTRGELLDVFREEGGLSTRSTQRYVFRDCPYIKVNVSFEVVGEPEDKLTKFPQDKITKISTPFLEWSIMD